MAAPENSGGAGVILFYVYRATQADDEAAWQREKCERLGLLGRVLVSSEGLNGTLAGRPESISAYVDEMLSRPLAMSPADFKHSSHDGPAEQLFPDLQVGIVIPLFPLETISLTCSGSPLLTTNSHTLSPVANSEYIFTYIIYATSITINKYINKTEVMRFNNLTKIC
jgi:hypothetical protein